MNHKRSLDWIKHGYHETFDLSHRTVKDNVERVDAVRLSPTSSSSASSVPYKPVRLKRKYRNQKFKCWRGQRRLLGEDEMKYYVEYLENTRDDSPALHLRQQLR
uniref:Jumonji domain containing 6, arginine demethylase and lysine hydroxylase n=1 Tax=Sphaeramia orbicularis TaxID=375764 RepID=A0A672YCE8_9TELE